MITSVNSYAEGTSLGVPLNEKQLDLQFVDKQVELLLGTIILLPENNNYDKVSVREMIATISQIDPVILTFLTENNLKIKLFDGRLTDEPSFQDLRGAVPRGWNNGLTWDDVPGGCVQTLAVAKIGASRTGMGHSSVNLELHEIGHLFERNYQELKNNEKYDSIWKGEAAKLMPGRAYFSDYQDEFFAEAFAMFYYSNNTREVIEQVAPKTFLLMKEIENNSLLM